MGKYLHQRWHTNGRRLEHIVANISIDGGICWHIVTHMNVDISWPLYANIYGIICHYMLNPPPPPTLDPGNIGPGEHGTRGT